MKRIFTILCALALVMAGSATALAADDTGQSANYYPISVEEYTYGDFDELRINKTYQLSQADDPMRTLEQFKELHPDDVRGIASLTKDEYKYATQVAVWASCGQLSVPVHPSLPVGPPWWNPPRTP